MNRSRVVAFLARQPEAYRVVDIGGGAMPLARADYVVDALSDEDRGRLAGGRKDSAERFTKDTWIQLDLCDRKPWSFADKFFDFALCTHVLEDLRDPVWGVFGNGTDRQGGVYRDAKPDCRAVEGRRTPVLRRLLPSPVVGIGRGRLPLFPPQTAFSPCHSRCDRDESSTMGKDQRGAREPVVRMAEDVRVPRSAEMRRANRERGVVRVCRKGPASAGPDRVKTCVIRREPEEVDLLRSPATGGR